MKGCYKDENGDLLDGLKMNLGNENSVSYCMSRCMQLGYAFAGVRNTTECHCSHKRLLRTQGKTVPDDFCSAPCPKVELEYCGAEQFTALYRTGLKPLKDTNIPFGGHHHHHYHHHHNHNHHHHHNQNPVISSVDVQDKNTNKKTDEDQKKSAEKGENKDIDTPGDRLSVYQGCYKDDRNEIQLNPIHEKLERTLTPQQCNSFCFNMGYLYAATKDGNECHCGDLEGSLPIPDGDSHCNVTCISQTNIKCGGKNAFSLYSTGIKEDLIGDVKLLQIGCLSDNKEKRLIPEHKINLARTNTPKRCIAYCRALGYPHAGVQYNFECFCGTAQRTSPVSDGCNLACSGDGKQNCGGHWKIDVYSTGSIVTSADRLPGYQGCYKDDRSEIQFNPVHLEVDSTLTPQRCISFCFNRGYLYAAIKDGKECHCGDLEGSLPMPDGDSQCNLPCTSQTNAKCGGQNAFSLYSTGIKEDLIGDVKQLEIGCLSDTDSTRVIPDHKIDLTRTNTPKRCIAYCRALGYPHAGVQHKDECFCGTARRTSPTAEGCNLPCSGDGRQNCGGDWRVMVYLTGSFTTSTDLIPGYQGCYKDDRSDIQLIPIHEEVKRTLTPQQCISFCFMKGFLYASTKDGNECHCGDLEENLPTPDGDPFCNVPCISDTNAKCGGKNAFSLYSTGIKEDLIGDIKQLEIGCISDTDEMRVVPEHKIDLVRTNTPKRCIAYCKALGYAHAGVQFKVECFCGIARRTSPISEGCNLPCSGDGKQNCGGNWRVMIYSTGSYRLSMEVTQFGCFAYDEYIAITSRPMNQMTLNGCIAHCFYQGLPFAHIYNGDICMCGRTTPHMKSRTRLSKCDKKCPGDSNTKCGGANEMMTYETGVVGGPILGKMESCYNDGNGNLLDGVKMDLGNENSVTYCIARCMQLGYAFAGLRNTTECHCSQNSPPRSLVKMAPDDFCSSPCPKVELERCGAEKFTALYRTGLKPQNGTTSSFDGQQENRQILDPLTTTEDADVLNQVEKTKNDIKQLSSEEGQNQDIETNLVDGGDSEVKEGSDKGDKGVTFKTLILNYIIPSK